MRDLQIELDSLSPQMNKWGDNTKTLLREAIECAIASESKLAAMTEEKFNWREKYESEQESRIHFEQRAYKSEDELQILKSMDDIDVKYAYEIARVELSKMKEEKERCRKLAVEYSLQADSYKQSLELCENMRMAREFEELLGTSSIPEAVAKVRGLQEVEKAARNLLSVFCTGFGCSVSKPRDLYKCERWCNTKEKYILKKSLADYDKGVE